MLGEVLEGYTGGPQRVSTYQLVVKPTGIAVEFVVETSILERHMGGTTI